VLHQISIILEMEAAILNILMK